MSEERDPTKLADELDKQADDMQERADKLGGDVADVRQDWQQKQSAPDVPGANPQDLGTEDEPDDESAEEEASKEGSPAPEAPPEEEGPASAEMASEGQAGPPADSDDTSKGS